MEMILVTFVAVVVAAVGFVTMLKVMVIISIVAKQKYLLVLLLRF